MASSIIGVEPGEGVLLNDASRRLAAAIVEWRTRNMAADVARQYGHNPLPPIRVQWTHLPATPCS